MRDSADVTAGLTDEDRKLVLLARGARARAGAAAAAALRDETGRTYVGADVALPSLRLSAVELCVAQAVAAGARGAEAVAVVSADPGLVPDTRALVELGGTGVTVVLADQTGRVLRTGTP